MSHWTYSLIIDPPDFDEQRPVGLLRQHKAASDYAAESLGRDGEWLPSDLPARIMLGKGSEELVAVTREVAIDHATRWQKRRGWRRLPVDLAGTAEGDLD